MAISTALHSQQHAQITTALVTEPCPHCGNTPISCPLVERAYKSGKEAELRPVIKPYRKMISQYEAKCKACNKAFPLHQALPTLPTYDSLRQQALVENGLDDSNNRRFLLDALLTGRFKSMGNSRPDTTDWLLEIARHWNLKQMLDDLEAIKADTKTVMECCTQEHFLDTVLRETVFGHFDDWNAAELARIMPELYSREVELHREAGRSKIEIEVEQSECHVTQVLAAAYRGCSDRTIRRMLENDKSFCCKHGKPSRDFLIRERNSKK